LEEKEKPSNSHGAARVQRGEPSPEGRVEERTERDPGGSRKAKHAGVGKGDPIESPCFQVGRHT